MSHQLATQAARTSRHAAQVLRYSAIVTAGMASIGLTVAAGSYVANQMAGTQSSGAIVATPDLTHGPSLNSGNAETVPPHSDIASISDSIGLASFFTQRPMEIGAPQAIPAVAPSTTGEATPRPSSIAGQLRLGNTYLGAAVVPAQRNSVSVTLDTNVFATVADLVLHSPLGETLGIGSDPAANTQLRTDVDTRSGEVTVTFTDPALGKYGVQFARHPAPAAATVPSQAAVPDQASVPDQAGVPNQPAEVTHSGDSATHTV